MSGYFQNVEWKNKHLIIEMEYGSFKITQKKSQLKHI